MWVEDEPLLNNRSSFPIPILIERRRLWLLDFNLNLRRGRHQIPEIDAWKRIWNPSLPLERIADHSKDFVEQRLLATDLGLSPHGSAPENDRLADRYRWLTDCNGPDFASKHRSDDACLWSWYAHDDSSWAFDQLVRATQNNSTFLFQPASLPSSISNFMVWYVPWFEGRHSDQYGTLLGPVKSRSPLQEKWGHAAFPHEANDALVAALTSLPKSNRSWVEMRRSDWRGCG